MSIKIKSVGVGSHDVQVERVGGGGGNKFIGMGGFQCDLSDGG